MPKSGLEDNGIYTPSNDIFSSLLGFKQLYAHPTTFRSPVSICVSVCTLESGLEGGGTYIPSNDTFGSPLDFVQSYTLDNVSTFCLVLRVDMRTRIQNSGYCHLCLTRWYFWLAIGYNAIMCSPDDIRILFYQVWLPRSYISRVHQNMYPRTVGGICWAPKC